MKECRFKDCKAWGDMHAVNLKLIDDAPFTLFWCTKCGRVQNKV